MTDLRVEYASQEAAAYAVTHWHYSRIMPTGKIVRLGAWEDNQFIGVVLFSRGASPHLGNAYELGATEVAELTRVALRRHSSPVSQIVARSVRLFHELCPGVRLLVSFADPARGHLGGIYQAGNWLYTGLSSPVQENYVGGRWRHVRGSYHLAKGRDDVPTRSRPGKHRYLLPLDRAMRRRVLPLALPYPSPAKSQQETPPFRGGGSGAIPGAGSTDEPSIGVESNA